MRGVQSWWLGGGWKGVEMIPTAVPEGLWWNLGGLRGLIILHPQRSPQEKHRPPRPPLSTLPRSPDQSPIATCSDFQSHATVLASIP